MTVGKFSFALFLFDPSFCGGGGGVWVLCVSIRKPRIFATFSQENFYFRYILIAKTLFSVSGSLTVSTENRGHLATPNLHRFG